MSDSNTFSPDFKEFVELLNRKVIDIDNVSINFIGLEELKKNKKAAGRGKDLNDLENLDKLN
jgi:predicted nucleotidyltransferase